MGLVPTACGGAATPVSATKAVAVVADAGTRATSERPACIELVRERAYCRIDAQCGRDLAAAREAGDRRDESLVLRWWGEGLLEMGAIRAAREKLDEALTLTEELDVEFGHAVVRVLRGEARFKDGERDEGMADVVAGRRVFERLGKEKSVCMALSVEASQRAQRQDAEGARRVYQEMERRGGACARDAAWGLATDDEARGDPTGLDSQLEAGSKRGADLRLWHRKACRLRQQGDATGAQRLLKRGKMYARRRCDHPWRMSFATLEMEMLASARRAEEATAIGEELLMVGDELDNHGFLAKVLTALGDVKMTASQYGEARSYYLRSWYHRVQAGYQRSIPYAHLNIARTYRAEAKYAKALEQLDEAEELVVSRSSDLRLGLLHERGMVALAQGRLDDAEAAFTVGLAIARRLGQTANTMVLLASLGEIHERRCELGDAARLYREAIAFMEQAGRTQDVKSLQWRLDGLGRACGGGGP